MFGVPLTFAAPLALAALAALPALWFLLRVTPPRPRRIEFPPLKLVADLMPKRETPARTPPWLLLLRILAAACLILA
ncbi:BatA domain-containing protein, partial [Methylobacterium haplocladii]